MEMKPAYVETKCKMIGGRFYCIYCDGEIIPEPNYENESYNRLRYLCSCQGAHQAARTKQNSQEE